MSGELTGKRVLLIAVVFFGVVIAANLVLMFSATGTFPGLVVKNSYVAGQGWNERTEAQRALGWTTTFDYADGALAVHVTARDGAPLQAGRFELVVERPANTGEDRILQVAPGDTIPLDLAPGRWRLELRSIEGPAYHVSAALTVPERG